MTLEQAIDRYTNNAEYERIHGSLQGCLDFRQLAEWLKDYKRLLEQEPYICDTCKHKGDGWDTEPCDGCCGNHSGYEPCDDAISREAAIKTVHKMRVVCDTEDIDDYYELLVESFKQLPPVTQKYGKWIKKGNTLKCPFCGAKGEDIKDDYCFNYCPNCGAKMQESEDRE